MPNLIIDQQVLAELQNRVRNAREYLQHVYRPAEVDGTQYGVDRSTIRGFRGFQLWFPDGILATYNNWARQEINAAAQNAANGFNDLTAFEAWYENRVTSLCNHFNGRLQAYQKHKLLDLFVKWSARCDYFSEFARQGFVAYAHCPLDQWSLRKLGELAPGTVLNEAPRMGVIASENAYMYVQAVVREACIHIECSPLEFDVLAWENRGN